jgi:hypothetical protein
MDDEFKQKLLERLKAIEQRLDTLEHLFPRVRLDPTDEQRAVIGETVHLRRCGGKGVLRPDHRCALRDDAEGNEQGEPIVRSAKEDEYADRGKDEEKSDLEQTDPEDHRVERTKPQALDNE